MFVLWPQGRVKLDGRAGPRKLSEEEIALWAEVARTVQAPSRRRAAAGAAAARRRLSPRRAPPRARRSAGRSRRARRRSRRMERKLKRDLDARAAAASIPRSTCTGSTRPRRITPCAAFSSTRRRAAIEAGDRRHRQGQRRHVGLDRRARRAAPPRAALAARAGHARTSCSASRKPRAPTAARARFTCGCRRRRGA